MWTSCPDAHQLAAYADGRLDEESREAITRHLANCDRCLDALAVVTRLDAAVDPVVPAGLLARARLFGRRDARQPLVRWAPALATAAVVIIVAGIGLQQRIGAPVVETPGAIPGDTPRDVRRGSESVIAPVVMAPADEAVLTGAPVRVEWSAVPDAVFYQVRIAAEDGALVWDGRASAESATLFAEAAVLPGRRYYVTVTAHGAGDRSVRSRAVGFQIERRVP